MVLNAISSQLMALSIGTGVQILEPTSGASAPAQVTPTPGTATLSVAGANGIYTGQITPPASTNAATLYFEVSYSATSNFGNATVLPLSPSTSFTVSLPGTTYYWRVRCTYDRVHFGAYSPTTGGNPTVAAGLQSSAATENAVVLNQTNYAVVDAVPNGLGTQNVRVYGVSGPQTMFPAVKGAAETILPSATIINSPLGSQPFVAYDGEQYVTRNTLPQVFADNLVPIGQVGTPEGGSVVLPVVTAIVSGGEITGYTVVSGGSDLSADVTLTITDSTGSGAMPGPQTIVGGVLTAVAPGLPGSLYTAPTVAASGGRAAATTGGGGVAGTNGGRLTAIQGNS